VADYLKKAKLAQRGLIIGYDTRFASEDFAQAAAYGHFGRDDLDLPWEKTDKAKILRKEAAGK
jgi:S-adenosylmethionine synthetase